MTSWLILQEKLLNKDRMSRFAMNTDSICVLCDSDDETHAHIFSDCPYTRTVLSACSALVEPNWNEVLQGRFLVHFCSRFVKQIAYLFISAAFHAIWKERNSRIFKNLKCNPSSLIAQIKDRVRDKLYSCKAFRKRTSEDQNYILLLF